MSRKTRRRPNRPNATGRNETSRFVGLRYNLLESNAFRALSPNARALLIEIVMLYNGQNNGSLFLSVRDGAARMGVVDVTAARRAFDDLIELGFIEMTQDALFTIKAGVNSRARCWRLTWQAGPGRKPPNPKFLTQEPLPKTRARKRMEQGARALKRYKNVGRRSGGVLADDLTGLKPVSAWSDGAALSRR